MAKLRRHGHLGGNLIGGDPETYEPKLWDGLVSAYKVRSVVDVGCGEGISSKYFRERGIPCLAIDGLRKNCMVAEFAVQHDFVEGPLELYGFDLAWCCEVVEHIEEQYLCNLLKTVEHVRIVAMTYGLEPGHHHVNMREEAYWISAFGTVGFQLREDDTRTARSLAEQKHFKHNGLIFGKS
jgi:SAM-dependent methyltransferase